MLRSGDRPGLEQEMWALLTLYQLLRMAMVTAVETRPGTDPDRARFTTALEAAKDQMALARTLAPGPVPSARGVPSTGRTGCNRPGRRTRPAEAGERLAASSRREDRMSDTSKTKSAVRGGGGGAVYGLGLIGALVYYWQHAHGFWAHIWAIVEAILWPAFVVYHLLGHLAT